MTSSGQAARARTVLPVLATALWRRPGRLGAIAAWSVVEACPVVVSGSLVAGAVDDGFRAGRPMAGFGRLGLLVAAVLVGALATRQIYLRVAAVVEPFRDHLVEYVVRGALRSATTGGDTRGAAGIARLTRQVEVVRDSFAGMIMIVRSFVFTVAAALAGLSGRSRPSGCARSSTVSAGTARC